MSSWNPKSSQKKSSQRHHYRHKPVLTGSPLDSERVFNPPNVLQHSYTDQFRCSSSFLLIAPSASSYTGKLRWNITSARSLFGLLSYLSMLCLLKFYRVSVTIVSVFLNVISVMRPLNLIKKRWLRRQRNALTGIMHDVMKASFTSNFR